ncbi:MAG: PAS domain-containing sensor histidine kinase [Chloroflexota bacterium]
MLQPDFRGDDSHHSERFVQSALDALSAHIAILDETGTIIAVNTAWCRFADINEFTGRSYGLGINYLAICDAATGRNSKEGALVSKGIRDVMANRIHEFRLEYPCHSRDEKRWFVLQVTRFQWDGHVRIIVAHQNVTELKSIQVELEESQSHIQTILDNVINGIITLNARGRIESVNYACASILGYTVEELLGQDVQILLAEQHRNQPLTQLLYQLQNGGSHEMVGQRKDGSTFPMYFAISRINLDNKRIYTGIIQDVTDRKQAESERLERERLSIELDKERELRSLKNRFITMMSHELRTPLASIRLSCDLLQRYGDRAPEEEKILYLENIGAQVEVLTDLIRDVSMISRSDTNSTAFMAEQVNMVEYCRHLADEFRLTHHETHTIIFSSQHKNIQVAIDTKLMRQVLSNLISNALKYTLPGGEVIIYVSNGGRYATVRVSDNGIGIPPEDIKHLFEPFHRGSNVDNTPGTGLGLAIARQAVELHNGTIKVESTVGIGTSITVSIPIHLG